MDISFEELILEHANKRVTWEWIGEGWSGDYDETDQEDTPLLRFSCDERVDDDWVSIDDASYCTRLPITTPTAYLVRGAGIVLEAIQKSSPKKRLEELSWFCLEDFEKQR